MFRSECCELVDPLDVRSKQCGLGLSALRGIAALTGNAEVNHLILYIDLWRTSLAWVR
jgi:hypothetical protein